MSGGAAQAVAAQPRTGLARRVRRDPELAIGVAPLAVNVDQALEGPSAAHLFGTDDVGRDIFARVVHGARVTLSICAGALMLSALAGGGLGLISGFFGGAIDMVLGRIVDVILSFPPV